MKFRDLGAQYQKHKTEIDRAIQDVIEQSAFILGKQVAELEQQLADYVGRRYCVAVGNGTDALHLSLKALNVSCGDAVIVPDFTYVASAVCANMVGATPVFADIDRDTFNMLPEALEETILRIKREGKLVPKVIIPVDLFGQPANYDHILRIAEKYGIRVLEDAAQGFGGTIRGKKACSFGDISTTSFFPAKPLGCYGDGGAIFTDDPKINEYLRSVRALGRSEIDKYDNVRVGTNSRLDTIQASILLVKLKAFVEHELSDVNTVAGWYTGRLQGKVTVPTIMDGYGSSWAQYTILLKDENERVAVHESLKNRNIPTMIYYPRCMHQQGVFRYLQLSDDFYPNAVEITNRCLSVPIHPYMTEKMVEEVTEGILEIVECSQ